MLIPLSTLMSKYQPSITGILHVGAHLGEESPDYVAAGVDNVVWIEANEDICDDLKSNIPSSNIVINAVVGESEGEEVEFHIANNFQSSSVLALGTHRTAHPEVHYISSRKMTAKRLDTLYETFDLSGLNFANLDIQGTELSALKGLGDRLADFDYIYSEVNKKELYVGCCKVKELDTYLSDFRRVETEWTNFGWGDAFYVRRGV